MIIGNDSAVHYRINQSSWEGTLKSIIAAIAAVVLISSANWAQSPPGGTAERSTGGVGPSRDLIGQDQFNKLSDYADQARRLTKQDKEQGKTLQDLLAEDKAAATELTKTMPLNCVVNEAMLIATGPAVVDGMNVDTKTYEVSCTDGMGYFLVSTDKAKPYGFSCFAADATRKADIAAGRKPGTVCQLPSNADMKAMAGAVLGKAGVQCAIKDYRYIGQNSANHTEFDEFACMSGQGYIVIAALPGAQIPVHVETCNQSAARGLPCKLSDNGALPVTLETLRGALAQHNVACDATDKTMRVIGQENVQKRYVVEFMCPQQPKGLVAYIPLAGNTAPFEALDCAAAGKRGAKCTLTQTK